jgi:acetoin utilization protein AcuB
MIRLQDIMSTNMKTVSPGTDAERAWDLMQQHDIHHLVVVEGSDVVGVLSARDLGGNRGTSVRKNQTAGDLMARKPVTAKPGDTLRAAANKLRGNGIGCLPIVDGGKVKGIVTITDCLDLIGRGGSGKENRRPLTHKQGRQHVQFGKR